MKLNVEFQEPDCKKKIKRIIAREGLIFSFWFISGYLLYYHFVGYHSNPSTVGTGYELRYLGENLISLLTFQPFHFTKELITVYRFLGYPVYLLIRFIIWAIRTLRREK